MRKNQPSGYSQYLSQKLDTLAAELRTYTTRREDSVSAGGFPGGMGTLFQAAQAFRQATASARQLGHALGAAQAAATRQAAQCPGGVCTAGGSGTATAASGGTSGLSTGFAGAVSAGLNAAVRSALTGDFQRLLQSVLGSLMRTVASAVGRSAGGGIGGSLLGSIAGAGLSLLLGRLFKQRQSVQVENTVRSEVLNFPRLLSLDFSANPASRLFGGRAVPRGPAFFVEVSYKGGAEDIITAKVASRLADLNLQCGI